MSRRLFVTAAFLATLAGCDQLGLESATVTAARVEADGKAVGAACRHGGRAIEDCFSLNRKTDKAAIYAGWREMDDYMRENKIEPVPATLASAAARKPGDAEDGGGDGAKGTPADKGAKTASADKGAKPDLADKATKADKPAKAKGEKTASTEPEQAQPAH
jgi:hypothetical protein